MGSTKCEVGYGEEQMPFFEEADSHSQLFLKNPEKQKWREEFLNRKLPHFKDEIGIRHIFTVKNATDQRNSGNLGCKNKYKRPNHGKKEKNEIKWNNRIRLYARSMRYK